MTVEALRNTLDLVRNGDILDLDLGGLRLDGERVFNMGEIKRRDMPQLKGFPIEGSLAERLPKDDKGKVEVSALFLDWLKRSHKAVVQRSLVSPRDLKASQNELMASKIAKHVHKMLKNDGIHPKFEAEYIVSAGGVLLDGHHGWASVRVYELLTEERRRIDIAMVNMHIDQLIDLARTFTSVVGLEAKAGL